MSFMYCSAQHINLVKTLFWFWFAQCWWIATRRTMQLRSSAVRYPSKPTCTCCISGQLSMSTSGMYRALSVIVEPPFAWTRITRKCWSFRNVWTAKSPDTLWCYIVYCIPRFMPLWCVSWLPWPHPFFLFAVNQLVTVIWCFQEESNREKKKKKRRENKFYESRHW